MHDIMIRGGTILDGTGGEAFTGDIAIDGGRLTAVGGKAGATKRQIEANGLHQPEVVHALPAGGRRLVQRVDGYRATFVAGTPVFENGEDSGVRPGRLVRAGR
jgi:N-acyl-D-aspartate/D-glutamate deacylase